MTHPDRFLYKASLHSVGSYQVSGVPYITGSGLQGMVSGREDRIQFPSVTKTVTVINTDPDVQELRVHFNSTGSGNVIGGNHYIPLTILQQSIEMTVKCKEIFLSTDPADPLPCSYVVMASLTGINPVEMFALSGSGLTE